MKVEFLCPDRIEGPIVLNLTDDAESTDPEKFYMKEASVYRIRLTFRVHNDIVHALKFCNIVSKMSVQVEKTEDVVGSYAPTTEDHVVELEQYETPSGYFKRGDYEGKAMLADGDGNIHWQFSYPFRISKHW